MPGLQWEAGWELSYLLKDVQTSLCHGDEAVPGQHRLPTSAEVPLVLLQNVGRKGDPGHSVQQPRLRHSNDPKTQPHVGSRRGST